MPYPEPPEIATSYTAVEQSLGDGTLPGQELDVDLAAIRASLTNLIEFVKTHSRSDGKLANGSVSTETLAASVLIGFDPPAPWATGTAYTTKSTVFEGFGFYLCVTAHTSGTFSTDLASGRWQLLADLTPPAGSLIASNNLSDVPDVPNARANLGLGTMSTANSGTGASDHRTNAQNDARFQPVDTDLTAIAALTSAADKVPYSTGAGTWALGDFTVLGRSLAGAADAAAARTAISAQQQSNTLTAIAGFTYAEGDLLAFGVSGFPVRLPVGTAGQILTASGGIGKLEWAPLFEESSSITLSGASTTVSTSLPGLSGMSRLTVWLRGARLDAAGYGGIQIGSGSFATSGYVRATSSSRTADITSTAQFVDIGSANSGANTWDARYDLRKVTPASDLWVCSIVGSSTAGFSFSGSGNITLAGPITHLRAIATAGNFINGAVFAEWR